MQKCFEHLGWRKGDLPHTEQAAEETLALPIFPELSAAEQRTVVGRIAEFFQATPAAAPAPAQTPARRTDENLRTDAPEQPAQSPHVVRRFVGSADDVRC
jgi:hypothetical protein